MKTETSLDCQNGIVNLTDANFFNTQEHEVRFITGKKINVKFDPAADCPRFKEFISSAMSGNIEQILYLQRWLGYAISGLSSENAACVFNGSGSGKTLLISIMNSIMGDYSLYVPSEVLQSKKPLGIFARVARAFTSLFSGGKTLYKAGPSNVNVRGFKVSDLYDIRTVLVNEFSTFNEAKLKSLCSSDPLLARHKYGDYFSFTPTHKLILSTNELPRKYYKSKGLSRRMHVINFNHIMKKSEKDPALFEKLQLESPGILNWLIVGFQEYQIHGLKQATMEPQTCS